MNFARTRFSAVEYNTTFTAQTTYRVLLKRSCKLSVMFKVKENICVNQEANFVKNVCFRNQQTHLNKVLQVGCVRALKGVRTSTFQRL